MTSDRRLKPTDRTAAVVLTALVALSSVGATGCASSDRNAPAATATATPAAEAPGNIEQNWGVEVVALRLTGADYMLDFRYKVLDAGKAAELFERANKPVLIHKQTGAKLEVPRPAKTGPLRPTNPPEAGRTYFILFSNPGVVKSGDAVTVRIGDFEADVVVE
ncbi:MAG TPA: hypothetical protein VLT32_12275 [Candidatus Sulfomarinibacteraceae bacterium]|nr:hypothetical protein [Candidatus Sulfomarinibacteraceae bacterium]